MDTNNDSVPQKLLDLLERQKQRIRTNNFDAFEQHTGEVDAFLTVIAKTPITSVEKSALTSSCDQLTLMLASHKQQVADQLTKIRSNRRIVTLYQNEDRA